MFMKTTFTRKERMLNRMILHSMDNPQAIGLLAGQTGIAVTIAQYARKNGHSELEEVADALLDNVIRRAATTRDISFAYGLSGICWGVEYLVQHGIMPGSAHEICHKADVHIAKADIGVMDDFSLETGLTGLWHYVMARIQGNMLAHLPQPFPEDYISKWLDITEKYEARFPDGANRLLRDALNGKAPDTVLTIRQFVRLPKHPNDRDLSLQSGVAGYVETHYL